MRRVEGKGGWMGVVEIMVVGGGLVRVGGVEDWGFGGRDRGESERDVKFREMKRVDELNEGVVEGKGKGVMLDVYGEWWVGCKEFEK